MCNNANRRQSHTPERFLVLFRPTDRGCCSYDDGAGQSGKAATLRYTPLGLSAACRHDGAASWLRQKRMLCHLLWPVK